jgi:hypothetical protein
MTQLVQAVEPQLVGRGDHGILFWQPYKGYVRLRRSHTDELDASGGWHDLLASRQRRTPARRASAGGRGATDVTRSVVSTGGASAPVAFGP